MNEKNSKNKKGMSMKGTDHHFLLLPVLVLCTVYQCHQI